MKKILKQYLFDNIVAIVARISPKTIVSLKLYKSVGKLINWKNPKDINEKIQWLKFNSDTSIWTKCSDKYEVRKFVTDRVGDAHLVKLFGVWDTPSEIDYSKLPDSFVLKTNHGAGSVIIVKDKKNIDISDLNSKLSKWLTKDYGIDTVEPHYKSIKKRILAEELLSEDSSVSSSIIDYKIWCFDGEVFGTWCCFNRKSFSADTEWHDINWNFRPEWSNFTDHYRNGMGQIKKPKNYDKMIEIASELSKGFPQVRVDLYNIDGQIYFGELTFTCAGGYMNFYSKEILDELGRRTNIELYKNSKR